LPIRPRRPDLRRAPCALLLALCALGATACAQGASGRAASHRSHLPGASHPPLGTAAAGPTVSVGAPGRAIPPGFLGLSMELPALEQFGGSDPSALDPVFLQLVRNIAPGQRPVLRLGGDSTDWSWYPVPGMPRPPWVRYQLSANWLAVARAAARALDARLIVGVNLEADSTRIAAAEGRAIIRGVGSGSLAGLELGNEPELYSGFNWYDHVKGRPGSWSPAAFIPDFRRISAALPHSAPLAGPAVGSQRYFHALGAFLNANPRVKLVTLHDYPTKYCPGSHAPVTSGELLSESASRGLAADLAPYARLARAHHAAFRVDEINAISCGGQRGLSDSFTTALWSLDALFALADAGVGGVNIHDNPGGPGALFSLSHAGGRWSGHVDPIYYGMQLFAQAAPAGSRILRLSGGAVTGATRAWATRAPDGVTRVLLINTRARGAQTVTVRAAGTGSATAVALRAPGLRARSGITLGGRSYGSSTRTGQLAGTSASTAITGRRGAWRVHLPAASAVLVTLPA
jgi:hypothetical protein